MNATLQKARDEWGSLARTLTGWLCLGLALLLLLPPVAQASDLQIEDSNVPGRVEVGVWLNGIHDMDLDRGSFNATFYIWWVSESAEFDPFSSLQVLNGWHWSERAVNRQHLADGRFYIAGFLDVTVGHDWDLRHYPFDSQRMEIVIETPYPADELQFEPQAAQSVVSEFARVPGFRIEQMQLRSETENYATNFGIEDGEDSSFSRLSIQVDLVRDGGRAVLALLVGFVVANIIALLTFTIDRSALMPRIGLVGGAIFAAIGNMFLLNGHIPPSKGSVIIDRIAIGSFGVITVALIAAISGDFLYRSGREAGAKRIDWSIGALLTLAAIIYYPLTFQLGG